MSGFIIPSKVLTGSTGNASGAGAWPYDDGSGDPFWAGGSAPKDYRWTITLTISPQQHSSHLTRVPYTYNAMDIAVGNYIADLDTGTAVKIVSITRKTDTEIDCLVEDYLRYNTLRYQGGIGTGIFTTPAPNIVVFGLNTDNMPLIDPIPTSIGPSFYPNLMSRFTSFEKESFFELEKENHGFNLGDLISADPATNSFALTDTSHPYLIGEVSYIKGGPNHFMIDPVQKIVDSYDSLIGDVGDIIYADPTNSGGLSLNGNIPSLIKLRNNTTSYVVGTGSLTDNAAVIAINGVDTSVGDGTAAGFVDNVNANTAVHGITGSVLSAAVTASSIVSDEGYGEPAMYILSGTYPQATINGVLVTFSTKTVGQASYGDAYALEEDMAFDINAANIPNITATATGGVLTITNTAGGSITIVNVRSDDNGYSFAGPSSGSGIPLVTTSGAGGAIVRLDAVDARAINLYDVVGDGTTDFGLVSVDNAIKAAAIVVEQGIRQASTYVVSNIAARDALSATFGDTCYVQDKGNGEWAFYIKTLAGTWTKISDEDSSKTDAQSVSITIDFDSNTTTEIYTVSDGSRVNFITVDVTSAFDGTPSLVVGDSGVDDRLMSDDQNDLTIVSNYSTTPSYVYSTGSDVPIICTFDAGGATTGSAIVTITYA